MLGCNTQAAVSLAGSFYASIFWEELGRVDLHVSPAEITRFVSACIAFTASLAITLSSVGAAIARDEHFEPWPCWQWLLQLRQVRECLGCPQACIAAGKSRCVWQDRSV